jgi:hypothetical protein
VTRKAPNPKNPGSKQAPIIKLRKIVAPQFAFQDSAFLVLGAWDVGFQASRPAIHPKNLTNTLLSV